MAFKGPTTDPTFLGKKAKLITKGTLASHQLFLISESEDTQDTFDTKISLFRIVVELYDFREEVLVV